MSLDASYQKSPNHTTGMILQFELNIDNIHTNIIDRYNPSVRIIDLVSHITYVVCVNFLYISGWTYSFYSRLRTTDFLRNFS